jgi:hypothetical protein
LDLFNISSLVVGLCPTNKKLKKEFINLATQFQIKEIVIQKIKSLYSNNFAGFWLDKVEDAPTYCKVPLL